MDNVQLPESQGLAELIQSAPYETPSGAPVVNEAQQPIPEAYVTPDGANGVPAQQAGTQQPTSAGTAPVQDPNAAGVTTQPLPDFDAERARYQAIIDRSNAAIAASQAQVRDLSTRVTQTEVDRIRQQDAQFRQDLQDKLENGDITAAQFATAIESRIADRAKRVMDKVSANELARQQAAEASNLNIQKALVVNIEMANHGIPQDFRPMLLKCDTPEEMDMAIASIKQYIHPVANLATPEAQVALERRQELQETGALAAGGDNAGTPPLPAPEVGSGDLMALIQGTTYQQANPFAGN
jgi:hypothetical protein